MTLREKYGEWGIVLGATEGVDMGFMSYVACLHSFGKIQDTP